MLISISQRLLTLLQLTRMALVFTAIADSECELLLSSHASGFPVSRRLVMAVAVISIGLYGYGMSLNDIIDRRRDRQIAAHRPLPSGRIGIITAHVICSLLAVAALIGGILLDAWGNTDLALVLVVWTLLLISFYDLAGKYLVAPGLLALGLVRFFHALIPAARMRGLDFSTLAVPVIWHPLLLFNHVTILSAIAYWWEEKRPALTRRHWWAVLGTLAAIDAAVIARMWRHGHISFMAAPLSPRFTLPVAAIAVFIALGWLIRRNSSSSRESGQKLMLFGLLWLIIYDACYAAAYVGWIAGLAILSLLPIAYFSVQLMRWWSKLMAVSQRPEFKRAGAAGEIRNPKPE
jgi:4-hydroxybenzoate polyprenyltransferase